MMSVFVLFGALLPLKGLEFSDALLPHWGRWTYALTTFFFPNWQLQPGLDGPILSRQALYTQTWLAFLLLVSVCVLLFLLYFLAISKLPPIISRRYITYSTLAITLVCVITPMLTSQDVLSYIMYARMSAIYHLNPLTTTPSALPYDELYRYIYWKKQPSIYGPTWILITGSLQWLLSSIGDGNPAIMVIALRILASVTHVISSLLIWSICSHLQVGTSSKHIQLRKKATFAFAWNPLLILESSINAHNDTFVLFFILLACWFLVRPSSSTLPSQAYATVMIALATAIKINIVLLIPCLILYLWARRQWILPVTLTLTIYFTMLTLLYLPFWQNGDVLKVLAVNPGANLNVNTLAEFLADFYYAIVRLLIGYVPPRTAVFPSEEVTHLTSMIIFVLAYGLICLYVINGRHRLSTPRQLFYFMALTWILYCGFGAPWFWPWYTTTFFGLFAILEATQAFSWQFPTFLGTLTIPRTVRLFTFGIFGLYFYSVLPLNSLIPNFYPMRWCYFRGLLAWLVPVCVCSIYLWSKRQHIRYWLAIQHFKLIKSIGKFF
jgi:hypothetical protein